MRKIVKSIWLGNGEDGSNIQGRKERNIRTILNLAWELEDNLEDNEIYLKVPLEDGNTFSREDIKKAMDFLRKNIKEGRNVLVHCNAGLSRSPIIVACYLHKERSFNFFDALNFIREKMPILPHPVSLKSAMDFCDLSFLEELECLSEVKIEKENL